MSIPALRQPKFITSLYLRDAKKPSNKQFLLITLKEGKMIVLPSDYYHGIINQEDRFKCVFCNMIMILNSKYKEAHISSETHIQSMESAPYMDQYKMNLVKNVHNNRTYCGICNVIVPTTSIIRHLCSESHKLELNEAKAKVNSYVTM